MKNTLILTSFILLGIVANAQSSDSSNFYYQKGIEEFNQRKFLLSVSYFEKATKFDDANADAHLKSAQAYTEMRKLNNAIQSYSKVLSLQPGNIQVAETLMNLYFGYRQFDKAIELANKCKSCANSEKVIGASYFNKEDYPQAEKFLTSYIGKNSTDAEAHYTLAQTYVQMEYDKKALQPMETAIKLDGSKPVHWFEYGVILFNNNQFGLAANAFNTAVEKGYPKSLELAEQIGYSYLLSGQFDKGEDFIMYVFSKKPGNVDLLQDVAEILYKKQQYDRSLFYCQKLVEANPKNGKALYQAGLNFIKKGNKAKGESLCDQGIELDPSLAKLKKEIKLDF